MTARPWLRMLFSRPSARIGDRLRPRPRTCPTVEALEVRLNLSIDVNVTLGGTLDINPVGSIFPGSVGTYNYMAVLTPTAPGGLNHGTMYRVSGTDAFAWGSGSPNPFEPPQSPSFNQNRISSGEGFRYVNDGGPGEVGTTESIPVKFSYITGSPTTTDTLVIHIVPAAGSPKITSETPVELQTIITSGQTSTLSVTASGNGPIGYQWYSGLTGNTGNPIAGATSTSFTTPTLTLGGQYLYWVRATNSVGTADSPNFTVTVGESTTTTSASPATLTYSMSDQTVGWGATVTRSSGQLFGIADGDVTFNVPGVSSSGNVGFTSVSHGVDTVTGTLTIPGHTHANVYSTKVTYGGNIPLYLASSFDASPTLTIIKADQTISGFGALPTKTYRDAPFTISGVSATSLQEAGGVAFASDNPAVATVNGTTVTVVGAGTAHITASQGGNGDWNPAPSVTQTLTVKKADQTISGFGPLPQETYGGAPFTISGVTATSGTEAGGVAFASDNPAVATVNGTTVTVIGAGTAHITASQAGNSNWNPAPSVMQTLTVGQAPLTVVADPQTKTFDGAPFTAFTAQITGFVNGENAKMAGLTGSPGFGGAAVGAIHAGMYTITPGLGTLSAPNYKFTTFTGNTLAITKAVASLSFDTSSLAPTYNGSPRAVTVTTSPANLTGVTITYTDASNHSSTTPPVAAGTYSVAATLNNTDYQGDPITNTLTVATAPLTITPAVNQSKLYGAAVPTLAYTVSGLASSDPAATTITGAPGTAATGSSSVGSYAFTLGTLSAGSNYTLALAANPPTFAVTPAPLTITANNATKFQWQANPAFAVTYSGFVNSEGPGVLGGTLAFSTPATTSSPAGPYLITPSGLTSANYAITYLPATLTVIGRVDVSNQTTVTRGGFRRDRATGLYFQTITVTNNGAALTGPLTLSLSGLTPGVSLFNTTAAGSAEVTQTTTLAAGGTLTFVLQFTNPSAAAILYSTNFLLG